MCATWQEPCRCWWQSPLIYEWAVRPFSLSFVTDMFPGFSSNGQKERRTEIKRVGRGPFCTTRRHKSTDTAVQRFPKLFTSFWPYLVSAVNFVFCIGENYVCPFTAVTSGPTECINEQGLIFLLPQCGNPAIFLYYTKASILAPAEGREGGDSACYCLAYGITWSSLSISRLTTHFLLPSAVRLWISRILIAICGLPGNCAAYSGNALPTFRDDLSVPKKFLILADVFGFLTLEVGTYRLSRNVGRVLPPHAAQFPWRAQISSTSRRKHENTTRILTVPWVLFKCLYILNEWRWFKKNYTWDARLWI